jgi:hypothetical protein
MAITACCLQASVSVSVIMLSYVAHVNTRPFLRMSTVQTVDGRTVVVAAVSQSKPQSGTPHRASSTSTMGDDVVGRKESATVSFGDVVSSLLSAGSGRAHSASTGLGLDKSGTVVEQHGSSADVRRNRVSSIKSSGARLSESESLSRMNGPTRKSTLVTEINTQRLALVTRSVDYNSFESAFLISSVCTIAKPPTACIVHSGA